jgi:hypothetical protein
VLNIVKDRKISSETLVLKFQDDASLSLYYVYWLAFARLKAVFHIDNQRVSTSVTEDAGERT